MIGRCAVGAMAAACALALYTLAELLASGSNRPAIDGWVLVVVALLATFVPLAIDQLDLTDGRRTAVMAAVSFVVIYGAARLGLHDDFAIWNFGWALHFVRSPGDSVAGEDTTIIGFLLIVVTWMLITRQATDEAEFELFPRRLGVPFMAVTAMIVLSAPSDHAGEVARAGLAFYAVAILALAASQMAMSGVTFGEMRAGSAAGVLLLATAGATVVGVLLFGLIFGFAGPIVGPILGKALEIVLLVTIMPFAWIVQTVLGLLPFHGFEDLRLNSFQAAARNAEEGNEDESRSAAAQSALYLLRALGLLVVVGLTAGAALAYMRVRHRGSGRSDDETRAAAGGFGADMRRAFGNLFRRGETGAKPAGSSPARRLYLDMLETAERDGHRRPDGSTPAEFAPELHGVFATNVTDEITRVFEQARYAGREPDAATVAELEREWRSSHRL